MSRLAFVCFLVGQVLVLQAMASESEAPRPNPLEHKSHKQVQPHDEIASTASQPASAEIRRFGKHHSADKSVAGGGVIIGGFATAIFAAVFSYIRVTRKRDTGYH